MRYAGDAQDRCEVGLIKALHLMEGLGSIIHDLWTQGSIDQAALALAKALHWADRNQNLQCLYWHGKAAEFFPHLATVMSWLVPTAMRHADTVYFRCRRRARKAALCWVASKVLHRDVDRSIAQLVYASRSDTNLWFFLE